MSEVYKSSNENPSLKPCPEYVCNLFQFTPNLQSSDLAFMYNYEQVLVVNFK